MHERKKGSWFEDAPSILFPRGEREPQIGSEEGQTPHPQPGFLGRQDIPSMQARVVCLPVDLGGVRRREGGTVPRLDVDGVGAGVTQEWQAKTLALTSSHYIFTLFLFSPPITWDNAFTLAMKVKTAEEEIKQKRKKPKENSVNKDRIHLSFACKVLSWRMKLRHKSFTTTT